MWQPCFEWKGWQAIILRQQVESTASLSEVVDDYRQQILAHVAKSNKVNNIVVGKGFGALVALSLSLKEELHSIVLIDFFAEPKFIDYFVEYAAEFMVQDNRYFNKYLLEHGDKVYSSGLYSNKKLEVFIKDKVIPKSQQSALFVSSLDDLDTSADSSEFLASIMTATFLNYSYINATELLLGNDAKDCATHINEWIVSLK